MHFHKILLLLSLFLFIGCKKNEKSESVRELLVRQPWKMEYSETSSYRNGVLYDKKKSMTKEVLTHDIILALSQNSKATLQLHPSKNPIEGDWNYDAETKYLKMNLVYQPSTFNDEGKVYYLPFNKVVIINRDSLVLDADTTYVHINAPEKDEENKYLIKTVLKH